MADQAWIHFNAYDEEAGMIVEICLAENDVSRFHQYVPHPNPDWRSNLGIQTEIHLINGSLLYATPAYTAFKSAVKSKAV